MPQVSIRRNNTGPLQILSKGQYEGCLRGQTARRPLHQVASSGGDATTNHSHHRANQEVLREGRLLGPMYRHVPLPTVAKISMQERAHHVGNAMAVACTKVPIKPLASVCTQRIAHSIFKSLGTGRTPASAMASEGFEMLQICHTFSLQLRCQFVTAYLPVCLLRHAFSARCTW